MATTLTDIARMANVSRSTAGWVLSGRADEFRISQATRERVLEISRKLNYRPSFAAKSLAKGRTYTIGFQCGNIRSPYYGELVDLAMNTVEARGYHLTIQVTPWRSWQNDLECLESLLRRGVDGVIFMGESLQPGVPLYEELVERQFPIILLNNSSPGLPWVDWDYNPGMAQVVECFKRKGYSKVIYVHDGPVPSTTEKMKAMVSACERRKMLWDEFSVVEPVGQTRFDNNHFRRIGMAFTERFKPGHAVVAQSDQAAVGFIRGLRDKGFDVPKDYSVVGIDGTDICEYVQPQLSSVAPDKEGMMRYAIESLIRVIEGEDASIQSTTFPTKFIERNS